MTVFTVVTAVLPGPFLACLPQRPCATAGSEIPLPKRCRPRHAVRPPAGRPGSGTTCSLLPAVRARSLRSALRSHGPSGIERERRWSAPPFSCLHSVCPTDRPPEWPRREAYRRDATHAGVPRLPARPWCRTTGRTCPRLDQTPATPSSLLGESASLKRALRRNGGGRQSACRCRLWARRSRLPVSGRLVLLLPWRVSARHSACSRPARLRIASQQVPLPRPCFGRQYRVTLSTSVNTVRCFSC